MFSLNTCLLKFYHQSYNTMGKNGNSRKAKVEVETIALPEFVKPGVHNAKEKTLVYRAVDYMNQRFHVGDHVVLNNGSGSEEWIATIDSLFLCPTRNEPCFRGRWFWGPGHVRHHSMGKDPHFRDSRCEAFELLISDNRDVNPIECIERKAVVLSWVNFARVKRKISRKGQWCNIYYCDRIYYHKKFETRELSQLLFPGDPIPPGLLAEFGFGSNDNGTPRECRGKTPYLISTDSKLNKEKEHHDENVKKSKIINVDDPNNDEDVDELDVNAVFII